MANPSDVSVGAQSLPDAELDAVRQQLNKCVATLRALTAKIDTLTTKMNSDGGITDTDYDDDFASTLTDSGVTDAPSEVTRIYG